ncbi:unnamed protein product, partial [Symbiodinium necroappetens]
DVAQEETETTAPEHEDLPEPTPRRPHPPGPGPVGPGDIAMPASQCERHARIEATRRRAFLFRCWSAGIPDLTGERIMEDPHFYREGREGRFGKPSVQKHLVRLERQPGRDRLGFGRSAMFPRERRKLQPLVLTDVLVISWIRDGALADFNYVSVNGISGDVQRMREALRSQVVEMEVMAPERWRYSKELDKNPEFAPPGTEAQNMELVIGWNGGQQKKDESQVPNFPQMAGLISAAEMMLKASASVALHNLVHEYATVRRSQSSQIQFEILASSPQNFH